MYSINEGANRGGKVKSLWVKKIKENVIRAMFIGS